MLPMVVCLYPPCGNTFPAIRSSKKYCSIACSSRDQSVTTEEGIKAYLLARVTIPDNPDSCWPWTGHISKRSGYGIACVKGSHFAAHRVSYETFVSPIPEGLHVLHARHCLLRSCINPRHLYTGTNAENMADKAAVGNAPHGSSHCHTHLTEKDVYAILQAYHEKGSSQNELARKYHLTRETIRSMIQRKTWRHVAPGLFLYEKPARGKMNEDDVHVIRLLDAEGMSIKFIAKQFHITPTQARNIVTGRSWAHIP